MEANYLLFLDEFKNNYKVNQERLPYNFNVLDEQCGHIVENSHTNMLIKLLQYKNQYGYVFLEDFFAYLGIGIDIEPSVKVSFERESYYKGIEKDGRIDGLVYQKDNFALIIENKVNGAGNQKEQIKKYIEGVCQDDNIFSNYGHEQTQQQKVWVMFLTKDGFENPDEESHKYMKEVGICGPHSTIEEPEGPRYVSVNYRDHILPWLKENVQPSVMQKEISLNSGLLQYIDFLEGMLGVRASDDKFMEQQRMLLKEQLMFDKMSFSQKNKCLKEFKSFLEKQTQEQKDMDETIIHRQVINSMNKIIEELNEEPLADLFDITRRYFVEEKRLMKGCNFNHNFQYTFLYFRDNHWPKGIHFEWYKLGIKRLENGNEYALCFHVESSPKVREVFNEHKELERLFNESGFYKEDRYSSISFRKAVPSEGPILSMNHEKLELYLRSVYSCISKELIDKVNEILQSIGYTNIHSQVMNIEMKEAE